jgi:hypothetical protein
MEHAIGEWVGIWILTSCGWHSHSRKRLFPRKKWSRRARNENGYAEWGTGSGEEVRHRRGTVTHVGTVRTEVRITTCGPSETAG